MVFAVTRHRLIFFTWMLVAHIGMDLKTELQALTASGLVFQPGPVFGRSNCKTLGYCIAYLLVSHMLSLFFLRCLLLWMNLRLPAFISSGGGEGIILLSLCIPCLDFLVSS